jgi:Mg2+-importing ATPase
VPISTNHACQSGIGELAGCRDVADAERGVGLTISRFGFVIVEAGPELFRTASFAESLLTELAVLLVLRTRRPAWRSRPHAALLVSSGVVAILAVGLIASPLGTWLGFVALPTVVWLTIVGVAAAYVLFVEVIKRPLFAWLDRPHRLAGHHREHHAQWAHGG